MTIKVLQKKISHHYLENLNLSDKQLCSEDERKLFLPYIHQNILSKPENISKQDEYQSVAKNMNNFCLDSFQCSKKKFCSEEKGDVFISEGCQKSFSELESLNKHDEYQSTAKNIHHHCADNFQGSKKKTL